jgi:hypothetical protein
MVADVAYVLIASAGPATLLASLPSGRSSSPYKMMATLLVRFELLTQPEVLSNNSSSSSVPHAIQACMISLK